MKKNGFTLAEVLITLGIVGVIAALTIPSMTHNVSKQQVGPALAKGINSLEAANRKALADNGAIRLNDIGNYFSEVLAAQLNGNLVEPDQNTTFFVTNDGISYQDFSVSNQNYYTLIIDINGYNKKPNAGGIDMFRVYVTQDGKVIPSGSAEAASNSDIIQESASVNCNGADVNPSTACTNTIIQDGWEMKY